MRVLFWSESFWPEIGGAEVLAARLLPALRERGHEFIVVATERSNLSGRTDYDGIPVFRFPFLDPLVERDVERIAHLRREVAALKRDFKPDLVHHYLLGPGSFYLRHTANVHPAPLLVTLHLDASGHQEQGFVGRDGLHRSLVLSADWVTACSAAVLRGAQALVPQISPFSSAIANALDWPPISPEPLPADPPRLLCVGRLVRRKGFDLAVAALAALLDRFPTARLIVAGDGVERAALQDEAAAMGVAHAVDFRGWVDPPDVPRLMSRATMVLMPSRNEGLPLVALQAAQMARPVVATRVAGLPEVVVHGETGLLVPQEDGRALAEAVASLLDRPDLARELGEAARRRALEVFSWERHVDAHDALYRKLTRQGSTAGAKPSERP